MSTDEVGAVRRMLGQVGKGSTSTSLRGRAPAALAAVFLDQEFDLIGASYGSLVALHLGHAAR